MEKNHGPLYFKSQLMYGLQYLSLEKKSCISLQDMAK